MVASTGMNRTQQIDSIQTHHIIPSLVLSDPHHGASSVCKPVGEHVWHPGSRAARDGRARSWCCIRSGFRVRYCYWLLRAGLQHTDAPLVVDGLKYAKSHEWVKLDGDTATVGITDFAQVGVVKPCVELVI